MKSLQFTIKQKYKYGNSLLYPVCSSNPCIAKSMGLKGREYIINNYNRIENGKIMNGIYNKIVKDLK